MNRADFPEGHGFKTGGWVNGFYRVVCLCGHRSVGSSSFVAHTYWREHMFDVADELAEVEQ